MLATTLRPSPAASINSASTFSVTVERMPAAPREALRSSSRVGGPSESTATSNPSRTRSPADGISRLTRTFSDMGSSRFLALLCEHLAQDGLQDAAITEVLDLDRGVHAGLYRELLLFAFVAGDLDGQLFARLEAGKASDVEGFVARETKRFCALALGELQGQHAHADQVRAVDAFEALCDNGLDAEQERTLCRPVARRAGPVLLAGQDDERHILLAVLQARLVDRGLLAVGKVKSVAALFVHELIAEPDVAERAPHHDLVVAAPRAVGVEVARVHAFLYQVLPRRHLRRDGTGGRDMVGGHRVPDLHEDARALDVL